MEQKHERKTYESKDARYNLNPAQVFDVVADLEMYIHCAKTQAMKDNSDGLRPATGLMGNGRKLTLHTEVVNEPGFLTSFDLAELVLSADNTQLTLRTHEHQRVAIPSDDLHYLARKYKQK